MLPHDWNTVVTAAICFSNRGGTVVMVAAEVCGKRPAAMTQLNLCLGYTGTVLCLLAMSWILVIGLNVLPGLNFTLCTFIWVPTYVSCEICLLQEFPHPALYWKMCWASSLFHSKSRKYLTFTIWYSYSLFMLLFVKGNVLYCCFCINLVALENVTLSVWRMSSCISHSPISVVMFAHWNSRYREHSGP